MSSLHSSHSNLLSALFWLLTGEDVCACLYIYASVNMQGSAQTLARSRPGLDVNARPLALCDLLHYIILNLHFVTPGLFDFLHTLNPKANLDESSECPLTQSQRGGLSFILSRNTSDCF